MADRSSSSSRPLLQRMLSFREPLLLIPYLFSFLSAFVRSYASFVRSFARSLTASTAKCTYANVVVDHHDETDTDFEPCSDDVEEDVTLSGEEVEEIMERIGLKVTGEGRRLEAWMGHQEVSRVFDADEPSFEEVKRAFAVFDVDGDGLIGATDLQRALAKLGFQEDVATCGMMIRASCQSRDARMNLFQFVKFLESGFC